MSADQNFATPTYFLSGGKFLLNDAGQKVNSEYEHAAAEKRKLDATWAGALLARLFIDHPWLAGMTIELRASAVTDDDGVTFRSVVASVSDVIHVDGVPLAESVDAAGNLCQDRATDLLENVLQDNDADLYASFAEPHEYDDIDLIVRRDAIAELLQGEQIDGSVAFALLFSDHVHAAPSGPSA
ncbi:MULTISPECIES: hypothetical protein [Paraburkholderia]|uniref:Uncharacterized protein n=1 Tax=Paraburkholderia madseniana TaxID=2599607 RepID=A0AAP5BKU3_9BURK|nr:MULTISPECIES: hypothetical protein [Paraburkholderia]MCX4150006.1 hypothetical protein [Paraburkholderia madseniana]MCX4177802.1 hypothetical protein [Paraburkholderia madseniana]MDN7152942.1 hypothetical protein [Paraburkholderia sp. WS6]MDQ6411824.1 hypothetical protein [Paraburkholderia madseniana]MDQ6465789.1 hypothetical protein [Paraburkholderia madseniana]